MPVHVARHCPKMQQTWLVPCGFGEGQHQEQCAHGFVGAPGELCCDVDPYTRVGHAQVSLQGDSSRGSITDDGHQLLAPLEPVLLSNVHLCMKAILSTRSPVLVDQVHPAT